MGFGGQFRSTDCFFCGFGGCCLSFCWFGFGGRRLCEPGRRRAGRVAIGLERKVSPPTPRRKIGRLLNQMRGGVSNPPPTAPNHNVRGHLLGGSLSIGPIVGESLLRGPPLELREHRLHVFCVFCFLAVLLHVFCRAFLQRPTPPVGRPQAQR